MHPRARAHLPVILAMELAHAALAVEADEHSLAAYAAHALRRKLVVRRVASDTPPHDLVILSASMRTCVRVYKPSGYFEVCSSQTIRGPNNLGILSETMCAYARVFYRPTDLKCAARMRYTAPQPRYPL